MSVRVLLVCPRSIVKQLISPDFLLVLAFRGCAHCCSALQFMYPNLGYLNIWGSATVDFPALSSFSPAGTMVPTQWKPFYRIDTTALVSLIASHNPGMLRSANLPIFFKRFLCFASYEYCSSALSDIYYFFG